MKPDLPRKRKGPKSEEDVHIDSTEYTKKAIKDKNKHNNSDMIASNRFKQKLVFPAEQPTSEKHKPRKIVKQKNSESLAKRKVKVRKTESQAISSKEQKPLAEAPLHAANTSTLSAESVHKNKPDLLSSTNSAAEPGPLTQKSRKAAAKSDKTAWLKHSNTTPSGISDKSSRQFKPGGTKPESGGSHKKKTTSSKKKEHDGIGKHHHELIEGKTVIAPSVDTSDPMALLMMMEGNTGKPSAPLKLSSLPAISSASSSYAAGSDSELELDEQVTDAESEGMSDWEEVYDHHVSDKSQIPDGPVEITLEMPEIFRHKKRQKKTFDWKAHLERRVKQFKKEVAAEMHKVHLLCLLALGLRQNEALNNLTVKAVMLSLLPSEYLTRTKLSVQRQVENLLLWYKRKFSLEDVSYCSNTRLVKASSLIAAVSKGSITDARVWILIFISILRTVGLTVRLVLSIQPMRFKAHQGWDEKKGRKKKQRRSATDDAVGEGSSASSSKAKPSSSSASSSKTKPSSSSSSSKPKKSQTVPKKDLEPKRRQSRRESSKQATQKNKSVLKKYDADDEDDYDYVDPDERHDDDTDNSDSDFSERGLKKLKKMTNKKARTVAQDNDHTSSESEFEESRSCISSRARVLKDLKILSNRKILSPSTSDDEAAGGKRHGPVGHDIWLEVYFPDSKKWVCFDCFKCQFGKPYSIENIATQPLMYVLGFNNDNSVKDLTARYAKQWLSHIRKSRIDHEWWTQTLFPFDKTPIKDNLIEDDEIKSQLLVQPMPTSIAELKNHPLYALQRHLLKFEAVYPETAVPLGYIKKEPVYARECVRTLHSRQNWLKEGRLVRLNETPYKMAKSRPRWNKPKDNPDALDLELFGEWQTEKYIPPPAVNGKVPRNEYGNVELFKPWMLPTGTVQVRGQGIQRVAKKLNIDVAPAMIGWDNHSGFSHPLMDGWVVCEEFADTLMAAWLEDQEIQKQREQEKREKRVYDNWRLLIRGLLIRERLKTKFLQETHPIEKAEKQETFSDAEEACDVQLSWPRKRQDEIMEEKSKAVQLMTERARKVVEKRMGCDSNVEVTKIKDGGKIKTDSKKVKVGAKQIDVSLSESKRKVPEISCSDSSSSEDEVVDPRLLQIRDEDAKKKRCITKGEDPDFVLCERKIKVSQKKRNNKDKVVAAVKDDSKEKVDYQVQDTGNKRRTSLARQAKNKVKVIDQMSHSETDDSEFDEPSLNKLVEGVVKDKTDSDVVVDGKVDVKRNKVKNVRTKQTLKRVKHEEEASDFQEDRVKMRRKGINEVAVFEVDQSQVQTVRGGHMSETGGGVTEGREQENKHSNEGNKRCRAKGRLRCSK